MKCLYILYKLFKYDFIAIVWYILSSLSFLWTEMSAQIPADTKIQHPPQQQSVHSAAVRQKIQVSDYNTRLYSSLFPQDGRLLN